MLEAYRRMNGDEEQRTDPVSIRQKGPNSLGPRRVVQFYQIFLLSAWRSTLARN